LKKAKGEEMSKCLYGGTCEPVKEGEKAPLDEIYKRIETLEMQRKNITDWSMVLKDWLDKEQMRTAELEVRVNAICTRLESLEEKE
jgi:predicted  nucleic acid-binding Zn ribbon protein